MPLIIDGYNLLHVTGIFGPAHKVGALEASREALLQFLANTIDPRLLSTVTIVFDARTAPQGLPREYLRWGLRVLFAEPGHDADSVIEDLVAAHHTPRRLTVVSSDHRLQRAARKRKATAVDSDVWYAELLAAWRVRAGRAGQGRASQAELKPAGPLGKHEVQGWLAEFGGEALLRELADAEGRTASNSGSPAKEKTGQGANAPRSPQEEDADSEKEIGDLANPFPPGYTDDLFDAE